MNKEDGIYKAVKQGIVKSTRLETGLAFDPPICLPCFGKTLFLSHTNFNMK